MSIYRVMPDRRDTTQADDLFARRPASKQQRHPRRCF